MSRRIRNASITAVVVVVLAGLAAGFASGSNGSGVQTVHIQTIKPHVTTLDFAPRGKSPGDVYVFDATVVAANGHTAIGRLRGTQTDIKLESGFETVQTSKQLSGGRYDQVFRLTY
jgi:hypothetical protein